MLMLISALTTFSGLIFRNRQLDDTLMIADYLIEKESTVQLLLRLSGGGYPQCILTKAGELNNDRETVESKFYPLYDKILNYWFPPADGYDVCPQWTLPDIRKSVDFTITFVIELHQRPLLLVEIRPPSDFHVDSGREAAIIQIRQRLDEIGSTNQHLDRLYASSAIGKKWRACYVSKGDDSRGGQPVRGVANAVSLRSADIDCWNPDITSDESFTALQEIVTTIKGYA